MKNLYVQCKLNIFQNVYFSLLLSGDSRIFTKRFQISIFCKAGPMPVVHRVDSAMYTINRYPADQGCQN